tara:strand:+ start:1399 stop:3306 length:1908 start_codon:yes stop_codon:yes gene_type:complete
MEPEAAVVALDNEMFSSGMFTLHCKDRGKGARLEARQGDSYVPFTSTRAWVSARLFDADSGANGSYLTFDHPITHEEISEIVWDHELTGNDSSGVYQRLARLGFTVQREALTKGLSTQNLFSKYLMQSDGLQTVTIHSKPGWSNCNKHFVLGDSVLPEGNEVSTIDQHDAFLTKAEPCWDNWEELVKLAGKSKMWTFALQMAFAGPLIRALNVPSFVMGGIHFYGESSRGKSRALDIGKSVWGSRPVSFDGTGVTLKEDLGFAHNDRVAFIDEIGQSGVRGKGDSSGSALILNLLYGLANGIGRSRRVNVTQLEKPKEWRMLWMSTGEYSIRDWVSPIVKDMKEGQRLRAADIAISHKEFDTGMEVSEARAVSKRVEDLSQTIGGAPGRMFITKLIEESLEDDQAWHLRKLEYNHIYKKHFADMVKHSAHNRLAERCALVAYAGWLAWELGILPGDWSTKFLEAPKAVMRAWLDTEAADSTDDVHRCAQGIVRWIDANRGGRLVSIVYDDAGTRATDPKADYRRFAGYIDDEENNDKPPRIYLTTDQWRQLVADYGGSPTICRAFKAEGILIGNQGNNQRFQYQMPQLRIVDSVVRESDTLARTFILGRIVCRARAKTYCLDLNALEDFAQKEGT